MGTISKGNERYVIYVFRGFRDDMRFEFSEFGGAFRYFKRFVREGEKTGMFHHNSATRSHTLIHKTDDFPLYRDRSDVFTQKGAI
jgi:hypothetical protein